MSRRAVLRRGAVVGGALVWTAPVVQVLGVTAADAASGDPTPTPTDGADPGCQASASGTGTVLNAVGALLFSDIRQGHATASVTGRDSASGVGNVASFSSDLVAAEVLNSFVSCSVTDSRAFTATTTSVNRVTLHVPDVLTLSAKVEHAIATAEASATNISVAAQSRVADLVVNGSPVTITGPNQVIEPAPGITIKVDQRRWTTPAPGAPRVGTAEAIGLEVTILPRLLVLPRGLTLTVAASTAVASWPC